ncbi:MAG: hypothetical protein CMH52_00505 [Myxococcales bacterium]|nr:hypothetical protein [Myxococcales bacterium]
MNPRILFLAFVLVSMGCSGGGDRSGSSSDTDMGVVTDLSVHTQAVDGLTEIRVSMAGMKPLLPGSPKNFIATGLFDDGSERDLTDDVIWTTSNAAVASFEDDPRHAFAEVKTDGNVAVTARIGGVEGTLNTCTYPADFSPYLRSIRTQGGGECPCDLPAPIPYVYWENAHYPSGEVKPLRFGDLHCDESVSIMIFVVGTTWCGACTSYAQRISQSAAAIEAAGGRIIFIELEDDNHAPCTSEIANRHLSRYIGDVGIRVGDADTQPGGGGYMANSGVVRAYPTVVIVRRSDMRIIADDSTGARDLDLVAVAQNPDQDWTAPAPAMVENRCDGPDEQSEPNNSPMQAAPLGLGRQAGGICDGHADFFEVRETGPWQLNVDFIHDVGDLDVAVWDTSVDGPLRGQNGEVVGGFTQDDGEIVEHVGPALIRISGFQGASASYSLTLIARP